MLCANQVLGSKACIMLIHKYKMDEFVPIYHELQALNHRDRECGPAGRTLQDTDDYDCKRFWCCCCCCCCC